MKAFNINTALRRIWIVIMWLLIMVFAMIILAFAPLLFLVGLIKIFWKTKVGKGLDDLGDDLRCVNFVLDKLGNVTVFNWLDFKNDRPNYGNPTQTVSEVLYLREKENKLTNLDALIWKLIVRLDKGHFEVFEPKKSEGVLRHLK